MNNRFRNLALRWIGLAGILAIYLVAVFRFRPSDLFAATQDDSIYFSSAQALANQRGYILPSVPGVPEATKYPILYPWILSWIWRWNPSFPSNLNEAAALTAAFGVVFLVACFVYLRRLNGTGDPAALLLTFFIALHPLVRVFSASILSDIPFAGLALAALLVADKAMRPGGTVATSAGTGILTGLSILLRIFGVPIAAGILAAALARRAWRQAAVFCETLAPFGIATIWKAISARSAVPPNSSGAPRSPGFLDAWTYYTSYLGFWKLSVPNASILRSMLTTNAVYIFRSSSSYFIAPVLTQNTLVSVSLMFLVTFFIFAGVVRQTRNTGWQPIHWVFPFYMAVILLWNYPVTGRFCLFFLPFYAGGLWVEGKQFVTVSYTTMTNSKVWSQRILAAIFAFGLLALTCGIALNDAFGTRILFGEMARNRSSLLPEKREAYQWISCCTSRDDVVIAYEDASLYLYSGRQSMRPIAFPTSGEFESKYLHEALAHLTDVARVTGARYWLMADDDFSAEGEPATSLGLMREKELKQGLPIVFQSRNGHVRVYRIGCDEGSKLQPCPSN